MNRYANNWRYKFGDTLIKHSLVGSLGGGLLGGATGTFMVMDVTRYRYLDPFEKVGLVMGGAAGGLCVGFLSVLTAPIWLPGVTLGYVGFKAYDQIRKHD
jgi:hypothetical protein